MSDPVEAVTSSESATEKAKETTTPVVTERERLIDALTKGTLDKLPEQPVFEAPEVAKTDETLSEEVPSQLDKVLEDKPLEGEAPVEKPKETVPEPKPKSAPPEADEDSTLSERTRTRITKLSQEAAFGGLVTSIGVRAGVKAEEMMSWVGLRAGLQSGDPAAKAELVRLAKLMDPSLATPAPQGVVPTEADIAAATEKIYNETFKAGVTASHVEEPYAREQARTLATRQVLSEAAARRPAPNPPVQQPQTQVAPSQQQFNPVLDAANAEVNRLEAEYAAKMPGWDTMKEEVGAEIRAKHAGANPMLWPHLYVEAVRAVQARKTPVVDRRVTVVNTGLRTSTTSTQNARAGSLSGRDEAIGLLTGKIKF